jgi:uncharacterized protein (DUF58 family)
MAATTGSFLDPVTLARTGGMPVKARVIVEGALSGLHRARLHGSSVEFAEHKEYSPGDEIRHIDWKAYAKVDRYYVKQFEQESQLTAYLVLDASGSMDFRGAGIAKVEYGAYVLAAMAYLLIRQQDKVGLSVFGDRGIDAYVPPRGRATHLQDMLAVLEGVVGGGARGDEPAAEALERIGELARRRRGLIVLCSDLFDPDDRALTVLRRLRAQRHDVAVFHLLDPHERELPYDGLTLFQSLEDDRQVLANPAAIRREYLKRMEEFLGRVSAECTAGGIDYRLVSTTQPLEQTLLDFLMTRARGAGRRWSF